MRDEIQNSQIPPSILVQEWAKSNKNKSNVECNFFETASDVPDPRNKSSFNTRISPAINISEGQ